MSIQNIMWTALPNGMTPTGNRLRLSVLVSPRLVTDNGVDGTLVQFPDFLDWPSTVAGLRFRVEFQGGPAFTATRVTEPGNPALDAAAWQALFDQTTGVKSYAFDDRSNLAVRSYPTRKVFNFLTNAYQAVAVHSPRQKPSLAQLGFDQRGGPAIANFNQIALYSDEQAGLEKRLDTLLADLKAIPADFGQPLTDFLQVRLMHQFLSRVDVDGDGHRQKLPAQQPTEVDFHNAVAAMGQYPKLLRALGLVVDLEVSARSIPALSNVRVVPDLPGPPPMLPWTAYRFDRAARSFLPAPDANSDVADGMLLLNGADQYDVVELDVDGAANKALDFAFNLARLSFGDAQQSLGSAQTFGLPSLRSAGFSAARVDRALRLVGVFQGAQANNAAISTSPQNSGVVLHAEEVTRGYRIDVWDSSSGNWHSLCLRDGTYTFLNGPSTRTFADEGFVTVATSQSADGSSTDLRLPESLFRWAGWSLSAPRLGKTIGSDSTPQPVANPATTQIHMETAFSVQKGSLPRLRFGTAYQFRARAVDLAGNSLTPDAVVADSYSLPAQPIPYLRYEPVAAPAVVLRAKLDPLTTPGESGDRIVIRSNFNTHIAGVSERHIAPPKTSQSMAETHGMFDTVAGPPDKSVYPLLVNRDGAFNNDPAHPDQPVAHPEAQLRLPYLPDPFAPGAAFDGLPGTPAGSVWKTSFAGTWPDTLPFRLMLDEGSAAPTFTESDTERVLRVHLPKADVVTLALSCYVTDDATSHPPSMLSTLKLWALIDALKPGDLSELRQLALDGGHWMLTPPRFLTLVHAVQQPLLEPRFEHLTATRELGQTLANLTDEFPISGKSTTKLDVQGTWHEPVDNLSDTTTAQPVILDGAARAFEVPLDAGDVVAVVDDVHEFHDTKHRMVEYTAVATTRFREYFPDALTAHVENVTRVSPPVSINILNSARPAAPKPLYVIPTFGWQPSVEGTWTVSKRSGGGLRVYLERPWFSSGEGELLGAVLWECSPPPHADFSGFEVPEFLRTLVTQWGKDPIWNAAPPPSQAVPLPQHFLNAVRIGTELSLDELSNRPVVPVSVAGHSVAYDLDRNLWYCDIVMDPGDAYVPFVRLALVRYQPDSVSDAHLSRVVLADFAQLLPDRSASITFDPMDATSLQLAISGLTYRGPGVASMRVTLQTQPLGGGADAAWVPLGVTSMVPRVFGAPDTLWTAQLTLPAARGARPFRLLIEEFETFQRESYGVPQERLVYADILHL